MAASRTEMIWRHGTLKRWILALRQAATASSSGMWAPQRRNASGVHACRASAGTGRSRAPALAQHRAVVIATPKRTIVERCAVGRDDPVVRCLRFNGYPLSVWPMILFMLSETTPARKRRRRRSQLHERLACFRCSALASEIVRWASLRSSPAVMRECRAPISGARFTRAAVGPAVRAW